MAWIRDLLDEESPAEHGSSSSNRGEGGAEGGEGGAKERGDATATANETTTATTSKAVRGIDIGTGASCVYPILGAKAFGWSWLASEVDAASAAWAQRNVAAAGLQATVDVRRVTNHQQQDTTTTTTTTTTTGDASERIGPLRSLLRVRRRLRLLHDEPAFLWAHVGALRRG